ncbi:MAG: PAS domain S-box protein, partial [Bacteroidetes bacterium]
MDARLIRYALEDEGIACDIKVVDTKAAFIESLEQESFDLIFADFSLPTFNAIDALGWVRERGIRTPVLLISGVIGEEFAVKSLKAGATDYVLKDHLARLAPAVRRTLAEYQQRRKQLDAEAEIQRQSELFGLVEKMVQLGTFTWEADGAGLYWSPGLYAIYEWGDRSAPPTLDALMGPVHPQDRPLLAEALSSAREQGGSLPISFRLQLSDQRTKYIFCQLEAPSQAAGPRRVVGVMQDVTRTKQTENALQRSERNFRRLSEDLERRVQERTRELHDSNASLQLEIEERRRIEAQLNNIHESIDDVIWSFSVEEGRVNYLSPSATRLFGLTAEQVEGLKTLQDLECLVYPEDRDKVVQAFLEGNAEKGWDFGFRLVNQSDESIHMVRVRAKQSVDERGGLRFDGITTDISERVRAEKRLKASEHRYRTLFDSAPDAIISMDIQSGNIIAVNHKAVELLGRSESHLRAMAFAEVFAPAARAAVMDAFGAYIGGASFRLPAGVLPLRLAAAGGQLIPVEVSPSKFWLGDRQVLSCFFRDVRERLEQEEAIRDLQEKYRLISENTLDILLLFTPDGALQYASPSLAEVLGSPVEAFLGKNILEQYSPQAGRQAWIRRAAIEPLLAGGKGQTSLILPVFDARGDLRLFDVQTRPIRDTDGKVQYLLSRCRDVTDRERAYQQVKEREAQYRLISENMSDLITINTLRGKLIWVSPSVQEVLGCAPEDILGLKALTFVHPEDRRRLEREMRRLIRREVDMPIISYRLRHQSGDYRWVETSAKGIFDEAGQLQNIQTSTRDISERKQAEEETRRALARER